MSGYLDPSLQASVTPHPNGDVEKRVDAGVLIKSNKKVPAYDLTRLQRWDEVEGGDKLPKLPDKKQLTLQIKRASIITPASKTPNTQRVKEEALSPASKTLNAQRVKEEALSPASKTPNAQQVKEEVLSPASKTPGGQQAVEETLSPGLKKNGFQEDEVKEEVISKASTAGNAKQGKAEVLSLASFKGEVITPPPGDGEDVFLAQQRVAAMLLMATVQGNPALIPNNDQQPGKKKKSKPSQAPRGGGANDGPRGRSSSVGDTGPRPRVDGIGDDGDNGFYPGDDDDDGLWGDCMSNIFAFGASVITYMLKVAEYVSQIRFMKVQASNKEAREVQAYANEMDKMLADMTKEGAKATRKLPQDVYQYLKDHGILIDGMTIDEYIKKYGDSGGNMDQGAMQEIKETLDNRVNTLTDTMNQGQTVIQQMMQIISAATTQLTNLIAKWGDLLNMVSQKMFGS